MFARHADVASAEFRMNVDNLEADIQLGQRVVPPMLQIMRSTTVSPQCATIMIAGKMATVSDKVRPFRQRSSTAFTSISLLGQTFARRLSVWVSQACGSTLFIFAVYADRRTMPNASSHFDGIPCVPGQFGGAVGWHSA
ncbi:hypothetical protein N182_36420 [Sinorhizobium sp. GL2]|nr:hypothetical protein N182_36420 [Sinorhizobium sp. GL2]